MERQELNEALWRMKTSELLATQKIVQEILGHIACEDCKHAVAETVEQLNYEADFRTGQIC